MVRVRFLSGLLLQAYGYGVGHAHPSTNKTYRIERKEAAKKTLWNKYTNELAHTIYLYSLFYFMGLSNNVMPVGWCSLCLLLTLSGAPELNITRYCYHFEVA